ncbi:hypothetical protein GGX14DRAFT_652031 [Mycena pura]|uniref:Nephrocystin 3-like N-terminal domain-containing protein n=1 Tax=Mycena pura TaxID=153505 RepID=A0AAD6V914_9AGAR|nr:hypothetical protein GGX14DRAFT_652031 [Mycena pura]
MENISSLEKPYVSVKPQSLDATLDQTFEQTIHKAVQSNAQFVVYLDRTPRYCPRMTIAYQGRDEQSFGNICEVPGRRTESEVPTDYVLKYSNGILQRAQNTEEQNMLVLLGATFRVKDRFYTWTDLLYTWYRQGVHTWTFKAVRQPPTEPTQTAATPATTAAVAGQPAAHKNAPSHDSDCSACAPHLPTVQSSSSSSVGQHAVQKMAPGPEGSFESNLPSGPNAPAPALPGTNSTEATHALPAAQLSTIDSDSSDRELRTPSSRTAAEHAAQTPAPSAAPPSQDRSSPALYASYTGPAPASAPPTAPTSPSDASQAPPARPSSAPEDTLTQPVAPKPTQPAGVQGRTTEAQLTNGSAAPDAVPKPPAAARGTSATQETAVAPPTTTARRTQTTVPSIPSPAPVPQQRWWVRTLKTAAADLERRHMVPLLPLRLLLHPAGIRTGKLEKLAHDVPSHHFQASPVHRTRRPRQSSTLLALNAVSFLNRACPAVRRLRSATARVLRRRPDERPHVARATYAQPQARLGATARAPTSLPSILKTTIKHSFQPCLAMLNPATAASGTQARIPSLSTHSTVNKHSIPGSPTQKSFSTVLPVLNLAKAAVQGIGIPGIEGAINSISELAAMVSTMKANKDDLAKLDKALQALIAINVSDCSDDLARRLKTFTSNLNPIITQCKSFEKKSRFIRFFNSKEHKEEIQGIRESIISLIHNFTFYSNISIEKLVGDMISKVNKIQKSVEDMAPQVIQDVRPEFDQARKRTILADLKSVSARYNAENTPDMCMAGTRVDIIKDIVNCLTSPPDPSKRIVMLSGSAGSGKSTIAKTVASILAKEKDMLAASFFFSREYAERREFKYLPCTLARQLAEYSKEFENILVAFLDKDCTGICSADPKLQFQALVADLLKQLPPSETPWVICLDALDECGKDRGQIFLRWLSDSIMCPHT